MVESKKIQVSVPPKTLERLTEFARDEGVLSGSGKPILSQTIVKMIKLFLDKHSDPAWQERREIMGGNTFGMVDSAVTEHLKKRQRIDY